MAPYLSVITTIYNAEQYVEESIRSILQQTHSDFEYVVVDDGSNDGTLARLENLNDPRLRVILGGRIGRSRALNLAWQSSQGTLIAIQDADDLAFPDRLEVQLQIMKQEPHIAVLAASQILINEEEEYSRLVPQGGTVAVRDMTEYLQHFNPISHTSLLIKRSVLEAVYGYDENLECVVDWDLYIRLVARGFRVYECKKPLVLKRIHRHQYFEAKNRFSYVVTCAKIQAKAISCFGGNPLRFTWLMPWFVYRLLPRNFRMRLRFTMQKFLDK